MSETYNYDHIINAPLVHVGAHLAGQHYEHLGHFAEPEYACEGHNEMGGVSMFVPWGPGGEMSNFATAHMGAPRSDAGDMLTSPHDLPDMRGRAANDNPRFRVVD